MWDLCKTSLFVRFLCQAKFLILKILNVFLWLKISPSSNSNKNSYFSKVSIFCYVLGFARKLINNLSYQFIDIQIKNLNHLYSFGCRKNQALIYPYHQTLNRVNVVQNESSRNFYITMLLVCIKMGVRNLSY